MIVSKKFEKKHYTAEYEVEESQVDLRLDQFIQIYLTNFSRQQIRAKISTEEIIILNRPQSKKASSKVKLKDRIQMTIHKTSHEDEYWNGKLLEVEKDPEIIFEDDKLIIISKPPFMSTHPSGRHIFYCATVYFETIHQKTIHSIHRLDRETSGVLLLGKDPTTTKKITTQFEQGAIKKCYFFIAKINHDIFLKQTNFIKDERLGSPLAGLEKVIVKAFPHDCSKGKSAKTHFEILKLNDQYAIGLAFPQTGRQHQIRVHAQAAGLPLVGDKLYLGDYKNFQRFKDNVATVDDHKLMELPRHALHAIAIKFNYNKIDRIFKSNIPNDLKVWIENNNKFNLSEIENQISEKLDNYFNKKI